MLRKQSWVTYLEDMPAALPWNTGWSDSSCTAAVLLANCFSVAEECRASRSMTPDAERLLLEWQSADMQASPSACSSSRSKMS